MTKMQLRFIEEYLDCLNATEAARRAGYSPRTAHQIFEIHTNSNSGNVQFRLKHYSNSNHCGSRP